jgi:fatty-acyl-CoA synthase
VGADELMAQLRQRKGAVHAAKPIKFVAALPVNCLGKVDKKAIRVKSWQEPQRGVH